MRSSALALVALLASCSCSSDQGRSGAATDSPDGGSNRDAATGGAASDGGRTSGGATGNGGRSSGGTTGSGGAATGGRSGDGATGGLPPGSGGSSPATGGSPPGTGGSSSGGTPATGGAPSDSGSDAADAADACPTVGPDGTNPVDLLVVADVSGSMSELAGAQSKWEVVSGALVDFITDAGSTNFRIGISYTPAAEEAITCTADTDCGPGGPCMVLIPDFGVCTTPQSCFPDAYTAPAVTPTFFHDPAVESLRAVVLGGGVAGLRAVLHSTNDYLSNWVTVHAGRTPVVIVVTDSPLTGCTGETAARAAAAARALRQGPAAARTFVIGIEAGLDDLSLVAEAGGTDAAYLYPPDDRLGAHVATALREIRSRAATCPLTVPDGG